jgi:hypothetical protein
MGETIVQQLRRAIDAKHKEAVRALEMLQAYLEEPAPAPKRPQKSAGKPPSRAGTGRIRPPVLAAFQKGYFSINAVAEQTGFTALQVRGVVLAPALKQQFAKKEVDGVMHYKFEGNSNVS